MINICSKHNLKCVFVCNLDPAYDKFSLNKKISTAEDINMILHLQIVYMSGMRIFLHASCKRRVDSNRDDRGTQSRASIVWDH